MKKRISLLTVVFGILATLALLLVSCSDEYPVFTDNSGASQSGSVETPAEGDTTVKLFYGNGLKTTVTGWQGDAIIAPSDFPEIYTDDAPYRVDENGATYTYHYVFRHWENAAEEEKPFVYDKNTNRLWAVYERFSVIELPENPNRPKDSIEDYRIISLSDLHVDSDFGSWRTATEYTFYSGQNLYIYPGLNYTDDDNIPTAPSSLIPKQPAEDKVVTFKNGTTVTYYEGTVAYVGTDASGSGGEEMIFYEDTTLKYSDTTYVYFVSGSYSSYKPQGGYYRPPIIGFYAGTSVTYHAGSEVRVSSYPSDSGAKKTYAEETTVTYTEDTYVYFGKGTKISIPDGTTVRFANGVGAWLRALIATDNLIEEWDKNHFDLLMLTGDIISCEPAFYNYTFDMDDHLWPILKNEIFSKLDDLGIPWFFAYGNHDSLLPEHFEELFGYTKNFALRLGGDRALILGVDGFATPNYGYTYGYGDPSDLNQNFVRIVEPMMDDFKDVLIYIHDLSGNTELRNSVNELIESHSNIRTVIQGHTHFFHTTALANSVTAYHIGNFSWCGDMVGMAGINAGRVNTSGDYTGNVNNDYYAGMFSFAYVTSSTVSGTRTLEYYNVFPELQYGKLQGGGNSFGVVEVEPFKQEYYSTKGEPTAKSSIRYAVIYTEKTEE